MKLGSIVDTIRSKGTYMHEDKPERRQWLDDNGFVWDDLERRWEDAQSALTTYEELNGDMRVPHAFEVPSSAPWGEELWGMKLGHTVHNIREKGYFVSSNSTDERVVLLEGKPEWPEWRGDAKGEEGRERRYARKDALDRLEWLDGSGFVWDASRGGDGDGSGRE